MHERPECVYFVSLCSTSSQYTSCMSTVQTETSSVNGWNCQCSNRPTGDSPEGSSRPTDQPRWRPVDRTFWAGSAICREDIGWRTYRRYYDATSETGRYSTVGPTVRQVEWRLAVHTFVTSSHKGNSIWNIESVYQVNQKKSPYDLRWYYSNAWEFLYEILHDC